MPNDEITRYLQDWAESAQDATKVMQSLAYTLGNWATWRRGVTEDEFSELMGFLRDQGLDDWFGNHPLNVDVLFGIMVEGMSLEEARAEYDTTLADFLGEGSVVDFDYGL